MVPVPAFRSPAQRTFMARLERRYAHPSDMTGLGSPRRILCVAAASGSGAALGLLWGEPGESHSL